MGIVAAIARVRASAKSAGLEGALSTLGAELKSDAIPAPLRDVAGKLAALLGTNADASPRPVPSLEVVLEEHDRARKAASPDAVCPFTGLRADQLAAVHEPSPDAPSSARPVMEVGAASAPLAAAPSAPKLEEDAPAAPISAQSDASAPSEAAAPHAVAVSDAAADTPSAPAGAAREKRKERLAGKRRVANTPARSATQPAAKQPRSRANRTRKKS